MFLSKNCSSLLAGCVLLVVSATVGCGGSGDFTADPEHTPVINDGTDRLKLFLKEVVDPNRASVPDVRGVDMVYSIAVQEAPEKVRPLKPLCSKLKSAGSDDKRREIAQEMLDKLSQ